MKKDGICHIRGVLRVIIDHTLGVACMCELPFMPVWNSTVKLAGAQVISEKLGQGAISQAHRFVAGKVEGSGTMTASPWLSHARLGSCLHRCTHSVLFWFLPAQRLVHDSCDASRCMHFRHDSHRENCNLDCLCNSRPHTLFPRWCVPCVQHSTTQSGLLSTS